jgi:DNA repair exonuclease SbcCD nuclease subunit
VIANDLHDHPHVDFIPVYLGSRQIAAYRYRDFIKRVSDEFKHVVVIAGNHEFYHGKWIASLVHLREEYAKYPNVYFLERDTKVIDDVTFIGGTLWTDCNRYDPLTLHALGDMMQDYSVIRHDGLGYTKLRPAHSAHRHHQTVDYFRLMLSENKDRKCVIVGHHAPAHKSISEEYIRDFTMNGGYYSDLSDFILDHPQIKLWTHGHMHTPSDYMMGDTRVVCNPRGYMGYESCADIFALKYIEV